MWTGYQRYLETWHDSYPQNGQDIKQKSSTDGKSKCH